MYTKVEHEKDTTENISKSLSFLSDMLSKTMGPKGRNVLLNSKTSNHSFLSNDGYVILNSLYANDKFQDAIIKIVREAIRKVNDIAGDGTALTAVLIFELYREALKQINEGMNPNVLQKGMARAYQQISKYIEEHAELSLSGSLVEQLAIHTGKDEEIGKLIAKAFLEIGQNGLISIKESKKMQNELAFCAGSRMQNGFSSIKLRHEQGINRIKCKNVLVLMSEVEIQDIKLLLPFLEFVVKKKMPLLIIASDITGAALEMLNRNIKEGILNVIGVKTPGIGAYQKDILADLAAVTGANEIVSEHTSFINLKENNVEQYFGYAEKVVITSEETVIINGRKNELAVNERILQIEKMIEAQETSSFDKQKLYDRISVLNGKMAVLYLGSYATLRLDEKLTHVIDAIDVIRSALKQGIVPGGGLVYIRASEALESWRASLQEEQAAGAGILLKALKKPAEYILENSGLVAKPIIEKIRDKSFDVGYDVIKDKYCSFYEEGIVDSVTTVNTALLVAYQTVSSLMKVRAELVAVKWDEEDYELKKSGFNMLPKL